MQLKERYNEMVSNLIFETIADKYDILLLIDMHISIQDDVPFFNVKNDAMRLFRENS